MELTPIIKEAFEQYSGAVIQSRALLDVRDFVKPSARQVLYCMETDGFVYNKPFKKTLKAIGSATRVYLHGDSSVEGIVMRAGQPFAMRYPLVEVEGSYGNLMESGNWAAPRYTSSRLSQISEYLFSDMKKNTIDEWRDNYDDTEKYPMVLPSKGYYNIVNGTLGIGVALASSVPQFNIREVNEALIKLLWNPEISFDEIYCVPDFATGAFLLNEKEIKESLRLGTGKACKLRSVIDFDNKEKCFVVSEIPYGVYTNTICGQLEDILNSDHNPGIDRFNDLTGKTPLIKIYLAKNANPNKVLRYLLKETSLQYYYSINMTMLENGRFPKVFGWKEALSAHLDHEKVVYRRGFEYDLSKIRHRLHIIAGLIAAIDSIDEVIRTIKTSTSTAAATLALQKLLTIDEEQAKAILDIKLARLAKLEISKLEDEQSKLTSQAARIEEILNNQTLFYKEIEKGLQEVADKFGDERRTKILNIEEDENGEDKEPLEKKELMAYLTNRGNLYVNETITYITQKRGGRGAKIKLPKDEFIVDSLGGENADNILLFSNKGKVYTTLLNNIPVNTLISPTTLFNLTADETITNIISFNKHDGNKYIIFTTKNGLVKKSEINEYIQKRGKDNGMMGIKLKEDDEVINISFTTKDKLGILTKKGNCVIINTEKINAIGRIAMGVQGIKLNVGDEVIDTHLIPDDTKEIMSISSCGLSKRTSISEFGENSRATKGNIIQKLKEGDTMAAFLPLTSETEIAIISAAGTIKIPISSIPCSGRTTVGVQAKKTTNDKITNLIPIKN